MLTKAYPDPGFSTKAGRYFSERAEMLAPVMVAKSMDAVCNGQFEAGDRPLAVAALRDALAHALKAGSGGYHFEKIEQDVFMDLPGTKPGLVPEPSACWLGVGIDDLGHVVFAVDEIGPVPDNPLSEALGARRWLSWRMRRECTSARLLGPPDPREEFR